MNEAFSIPFSPLAGTAENRWLRLVQVGADDDIVTMDEAAELIDALYKISPCDTGTGGSGGGENAPEEPTEEEFDALSAEALGELCAGQDHWDVQVDLLRSHQSPAAWRVQAGDAEHVSTEIVVETRTETVSLDGADHHDLERPYHAGLRVVGAEVVDVRGSTVNFARPVTGRVRLTYNTRFERLTLRVPATPDEHGQAQAEPASVIAFWDRRAAQLELKQPEPDDGVSAAELADLCRASAKHRPGSGGGCWERLSHYSLCRCDESPAPDGEWEEEVGADCPEGVKGGGYLGVRRVLDGYTGCPGETEEISEWEYYKETCCHAPTKILPTCRTSYRSYQGGAPIEGGEDAWRERYGGDVTFTAVAPPDGICGKEITTWNVERQNCCDDVKPLRLDPDSARAITEPGHLYWVQVLDGKDGVDFRWRAFGGILIRAGSRGVTAWTGGRSVSVYFEQSVCPRPYLTVTDGCTELKIELTGPESDPVALTTEDLALEPNTRFSLQAVGGVGPYTWMATGGLKYLGYSQEGSVAIFETGDPGEWCVETATVIDQCGNSDSCTVRNARTGRWSLVPSSEYDPCAPPVRGGAYDPPIEPRYLMGQHDLTPVGGYRMRVSTSGVGPRYTCDVGLYDCPPMTIISKTSNAFLAAWCSSLPGGDEFDPSCGCRKLIIGRPAYTSITEKVIALTRWECG